MDHHLPIPPFSVGAAPTEKNDSEFKKLTMEPISRRSLFMDKITIQRLLLSGSLLLVQLWARLTGRA